MIKCSKTEQTKQTDQNELTIRPINMGDLPSIKQIYNHSVKTSIFTLDLEEKDDEAMLKWYQSHTERYPACVAIVNDTIVGFASLSKWAERKGYFPSCEASIYLSPIEIAQGYGDHLMQWLLDRALAHSFSTVLSFMTSTNKLAKNLVTRHGFRYIGTMEKVGFKHDKYVDISMYQRIFNVEN